MKRFFTLLALVSAVLLAGCRKDAEECLTTGSASPSNPSLTDPELAWSKSAYTATYGAANTFPTLSKEGSPTISYSSSETAVATIDGSGSVTLVAEGQTVITASCAEDDTYQAGKASYTLTVKAGDPALTWSCGNEATVYATLGADNDLPTLSFPEGLAITYASSNPDVASVASDGTITLAAEGETTITAAFAGSGQYNADEASFKLTVEAEGSSLISPDLSWDVESFEVTIGDFVPFPTLSYPDGLTISYASTNPDVATINESGSVTLVSAGTTTITATSEANSTYRAGSASYKLTVLKAETVMSWSSSEVSVNLEAGSYNLPTLTVEPSSLASSVTYSSSIPSVADIGTTSGTVTVKAAGTTVITAAFAGNDTYAEASASYTLTVRNGSDSGAGTYTYASNGATDTDDDIAGTVFTRMVTVTYSTSGSATVTGTNEDVTYTVSGNDVTLTNSGSENIVYCLTGTTTDGYFKLYSERKQAILLSGVTITNKGGAAINNQSGKRTFVILEGNSKLTDCAVNSSGDYPDETSAEDMKAAFFSEGQLVFCGSGSLTVTANGKSGITSDDYVRIAGTPSITVSAGSSAGHGIRGKESVFLDSGEVNVTVAAAMKKGLNADSLIEINGGTATVTCTGGTAYDSEDQEYKASTCIKVDDCFRMTGGTVTLKNSGQGGKGIRAGSDETNTSITDSEISGGTLTITTTGANHSTGDKSPKGIKVGWTASTSSGGGGGPGGGGPGGGGPGGGSSSTGYGNLIISGGTVNVQTSGTYGEAIESKGNITLSGGDVIAVSAKDDAINAGGQITFSGARVYAYASNNDAIDSNYGKSGAITISGGVVIAHGTKSPEEGLDCDSNSYIQIKGGTVFSSGGQQSNSGSPTCSQPVHYLRSYSLSSGWFTVTDSSSKVILSVYVPRSMTQCYSFITSGSMSSGSTYKYGVLSSAPSSGATASWPGYYYAGGTATVSTGSWTAGSGYTYGGSSGW